MPAPAGYLAEEMIADAVAELIVGVTRDPTGLMALTIGAGGILTELLRDTATLILPATAGRRSAPPSPPPRSVAVLEGYRGRPAADLRRRRADGDPRHRRLSPRPTPAASLELDVNPLIARPPTGRLSPPTP